MKAVVYARFSSDGQRDSSIEDQERNCRRRADAESWDVIEVYADRAISGSTADRPAYQAMLSAAGQFDILLVDDLSRLSRDTIEQERAIRRLEFQGVRIVATSDGYDSATGLVARKVQRNIKGLFSELYIDELASKVHRGQTGQALKGRWNGGRPYGYKLMAIRDTSQRDAYGEYLQIGTRLEIEPTQAEIVKEIFERAADGASCLAIAKELNGRGVPSPGSTWRRKIRRCHGWADSGVRVILRNELYRGRLTWNKVQLQRDPETHKYRRKTRPESEWITHQMEELRIVSDDLFQRASRRGQPASPGDSRLSPGQRPKYPLSGLLVCQKCGAKYVMTNERNYGCGSYAHGRACSNSILIRRDAAEAQILGPVRDELLTPASVNAMAIDLQQAFSAYAAATRARAAEQPRQVAELEARIQRLRARLAGGDPDMTPDELLVAIGRAEEKLAAERQKSPTARSAARVVSILPKAAAEIRTEVGLALSGRSTERTRRLLRSLFGRIELEPDEDGGLWAHIGIRTDSLLLRAGVNSGRGERI